VHKSVIFTNKYWYFYDHSDDINHINKILKNGLFKLVPVIYYLDSYYFMWSSDNEDLSRDKQWVTSSILVDTIIAYINKL